MASSKEFKDFILEQLANHYLLQNLLLLVYPYIKKMSSY